MTPMLGMTTEQIVDLIKGYGLGVLTLGFFVLYLRDELRQARAREIEQKRELMEITRESLTSIGQMTKMVENLTPLISGLSLAQKSELERTCASLKEHISASMEKLETNIIRLTSEK